VAVPWLYGTIYPSCLKHIEALECPDVEIMPPYYVKPKKAWKASRDPKDIEEKYGPSAANVNRYIRAFMRTDATHMLMVDADMEIPPHALDELLRLDVDIASGVSVGHASAQMSTVNKWFPKPRPKAHRSKPYRRFLRPAEIFGKMLWSPPHKLMTGAFCLLTKRRVFEKHHPKLSPLKFRWNPPQRFGIDLTFWEDARKWGFTSAIHGGVVCGHLPEFPLSELAKVEWTL
jgi:hypothetical protein